ncbi:hypothetical protein AC579_5720 [Pseudocercospora musae]|uniref:Uncharacterized protein n=1 Tax=Pseudocercospora musae TaxID=113226 RepID=A0A139IRV9_9PEZI|nr:hypothetical protein AC579_5720 [Pseudocercospora musae]
MEVPSIIPRGLGKAHYPSLPMARPEYTTMSHTESLLYFACSTSPFSESTSVTVKLSSAICFS